jgi:Glycosyltransferase family 10 (fucosyltransferase) C-term
MILLATIYVANIVIGHYKTMSPSSSDSHNPVGVQDIWKNSNFRIPRANEGDLPSSATSSRPNVAIPPDSRVQNTILVGKDELHMEEPDIHMQPPIKVVHESKPTPDEASLQDKDLHQLIVGKKGTGPTHIAYVQDITNDRLHPVFREVAVHSGDQASVVASNVQVAKVAPCLQLESTGKAHHWTKQQPCLDTNSPQIAYNSASFPRTWCGQEIGPGTAVIMREHCSDAVVHLFGTETASASGRGMPPMILKMFTVHHSVEDLSFFQNVSCDVPCLEQPGTIVAERIRKRSFAGEPWTIVQTTVDPSTNPNAQVERTDYRRDTFYSTMSFMSDLPLTYYDPEKFSVRNRPAVSYDTAFPKAVYIIRGSCGQTASRRTKYYQTLILKKFSVDSMGDCDHTVDVPPGKSIETSEGRIEIMKDYRFVLAFDRTKDKDFISTLVWEALVSGSVPVVVGAENVGRHLPKNSFIDHSSYPGWEELADDVIAINESKERWEAYHAWRTDEVELAKFEALYEFSKTNQSCRLCRWGYAKKYGLGWDRTKQQVREPRFSRTLCTTDKTGLASKPFQEAWISRNEDDEIAVPQEGGAEHCSPTASSTIDNKSTYKIERSLLEHDGVIDIVVEHIERESTKQELVLRLSIPGLRNSEGANFANTHSIVKDLTYGPVVSSISLQDEFSKVTILADWTTLITSPAEGVVEIVVVEQNENGEQPESPLFPNIPKRIRVILEDMDFINDKMTEYFPSPFAKRAIKDFVDPLEIYYTVS